MADTGRRSRGQFRNRKQVEQVLGRINTLIDGYERRVRVNPADAIAGSSRIVLLHLLAEARQCLLPGAISSSIDERLIDLDAANEDFRPRVADELDLLRLIKHELDGQLAGGSPPNFRAAKPPSGNPPQPKWGGGPGSGEPHRNRRTQQAPAEETPHLGCAAFPPGTSSPV
jgi:hypothetical protein